MSRPTERIRFYGLGLRFVERRDGPDTLEVIDLEGIRQALGDELLGGFLRLFVWADRLQSLYHLAYWNDRELPRDSVAYERNLYTMVWFAGGILFEAADAIDQLAGAGVETHLSDRTAWDELRDMSRRWTNETRLRRVRNNIGFHCDPEVMKRGIEAACAEGDRRIIMAWDDETAGKTSLRAGLETLLQGMEMKVSEFGSIFEVLSEDHRRFSDLVQAVFRQVLVKHGGV
jgi:hypothetical protein